MDFGFVGSSLVGGGVREVHDFLVLGRWLGFDCCFLDVLTGFGELLFVDVVGRLVDGAADGLKSLNGWFVDLNLRGGRAVLADVLELRFCNFWLVEILLCFID